MATSGVKQYVKDVIAHNDPGDMIIDVAAGDEPNFYEELFPGKTFHKLDMRQNHHKTITHINDIYNLPAELIGRYTTVLFMETLEHVPYPHEAVFQIARLLKSGGLLILSSVTCWGLHNHPKDYWRILPDAMTLMLQGATLKILEVKLDHPNVSQPCHVLAYARKP